MSERDPIRKDTTYDQIRVAQYKANWVECPRCNVKFNLDDRQQWTGMLHRPCGQRLMVENHKYNLKFVWCLKANLSQETSRFEKGTMVFMYPPIWGDGYDSIKVIGKDKETNKFIEIIVNQKKLENFKVVKVTKPDIISRLSSHWKDSEESRKIVYELEKEMNRRHNEQNSG